MGGGKREGKLLMEDPCGLKIKARYITCLLYCCLKIKARYITCLLIVVLIVV